ncbi:SDR family oxidoreductase [Methylobacterium phyllostachyos]|uniref:SDR family oxidoreductase n=1 Tax=Methylobacterium phyllostachyos TaxID=582672 RepID=UPI001FCDE475|nr:NAD(P)H-binding protein [Methylobacterium phyllostachyos]
MSILDPSRPILVYLANGVQGRAVVRAALRRNLRVRALVRDPARAAALAGSGVELVQGDLHDAASLRRVSAGLAHAVLQIPTGPAQVMGSAAANALAAASACGFESLILKLASASRPSPCPEPSFVASYAVEDLVRRSGLPFAIVRPTLYLDNLLKPSARKDIAEAGLFAPPIPAAQRIAWTSADDCAEAALTLLERGAYGGDHRLAGPESVTGDTFAARVAAGLGRPLVYRAQSLEAFEREIDAAMGAGSGSVVASKFRYFAGHPEEAQSILADPFAPRPGLEGFRPTGITEWVRAHRQALLGTAG